MIKERLREHENPVRDKTRYSGRGKPGGKITMTRTMTRTTTTTTRTITTIGTRNERTLRKKEVVDWGSSAIEWSRKGNQSQKAVRRGRGGSRVEGEEKKKHEQQRHK